MNKKKCSPNAAFQIKGTILTMELYEDEDKVLVLPSFKIPDIGGQ